MKIKSLIRDQNQNLVPAEVEVSLMPGLPTIQFLGLPDQIIKESIHRIKGAIRHQNFEFPKSQQVFVNIRPNHLKKSSRGLELAVATGILWETGQLPRPLLRDDFYIYGELGINGEVFEPEDLASDFDTNEEARVLTGSLTQINCPFHRHVIHQLRDLSSPNIVPPEMHEQELQRPSFGLELNYNAEEAKLLKVSALGGHSMLLAGPAGSGKSTLAKALMSFVSEPTPEEILEMKKINKSLNFENSLWRPMISPHHSSTPLSLIGGGVPLQLGEITRAHRGVLILDELLEFHPKVQETLREPMEEGKLRIARGGRVGSLPAMAQVIATTNLCPCGDFIPGCRPATCRYSKVRCDSYAQRLSGPLVDRFEILHFTKRKKMHQQDDISGQSILQNLNETRAWLKTQNRRNILNARTPLAEVEATIDRFHFKYLLAEDLGSIRRHQALVRVARTLADLEFTTEVQTHHMEEAKAMTWTVFEKLKRWD